jgi:cobyrinic acid a,c-diamide synthase
MKKPLFIIAGTNSGCGKTTVTMGILHSLIKKKLNVATFKVGPDYIDPGYHRALTGKSGCNLDSWMMSKKTIHHLVYENLRDEDIGVIEGVMGLYDGISGDEYPEGSSAHIAEILETPVVLVVNARGMAQSIVPLVNGFTAHNKNIKFLGVVLNRVGSLTHYKMLQQLIERKCLLPCLGFINKLGFSLPERHLGLVPFQELKKRNFNSNLDEIAENIDIDLILEKSAESSINIKTSAKNKKRVCDLAIAVARDEVFNFYYEDNLNVLKEHGVKLEFFSPIYDKSLPENINGIYFGGGFPEIFAKELLTNKAIMEDIRNKFINEISIYAECGGLIYLFETLIDHENNKHNMVGLIKGTIKMENKRQALGYYEAKLNDSDLSLLRGHQFHYSKVIGIDDPEVLPLYQIKKPSKNNWETEGYKKRNLIASYLHLHFRDQMEFVHYFLEKSK